jgi:hypothetical protein
MKTICWMFILLLAGPIGCADVGGSAPGQGKSDASIDVPGTTIENRSALAYAVGQLRIYANTKYNCGTISIVNARRTTTAGDKGEFGEDWEADVCGERKIFKMSFVPDMTGSLVLTIRE